MSEDLRDKPYLSQDDILRLKFIRTPGIYHYRTHYRRGLRSHLIEILDPRDIESETKGVVIDGLRRYPTAEPLKMLRIFRTRFDTLKEAEEEIKRVKIVETYLAPEHMAMSEEFLVTYIKDGKYHIILCGLQDYVKGEILDPWSPLDRDHLVSFLSDMEFKKDKGSALDTDKWIHSVREKAENFIGKAKQMIEQAHHVPDLAGVGNLLLTQSGEIKLVDINNVSRVSFDSTIKVDDRGYPVCDRSIEVLSLLERKLLARPLSKMNPIYQTFLDPGRMKEVQAKEEAFNLAMKPSLSYSGAS